MNKSRNLIYMVAIDSDKSQFKNSNYAQYSIESWMQWCLKNKVDFIVNKVHNEKYTFPIWNKELVYDIGKDYEKIGIVDSDTIIHPDAPSPFDLFTEEEFCAVGDLCDLNWLLSSIEQRQRFFPDIKLNLFEYFNAGIIFLGNKHLGVFKDLLDLYLDNQDEIDAIKGGGKEQTLLNFVVQSKGINVKLLDPSWNLLSIHRKNMFTHNWQLRPNQNGMDLSDKMTWPYFLKYAYIWHFTGFPIEDRTKYMKSVWDIVKSF